MRNLKLITMVFAILGLTLLGCLPCNPTTDRKDVTSTIGAGGILHIFQDANLASSAELPDGSKTHFIDSEEPIVNESVYLETGTTDIQSLEIRVEYEYHADSNSSPAILEFTLKDKSGNVLWSAKESYTPSQVKVPNQRGETSYKLDLELPEDTRQIFVEVKPVSAGDYGFYISNLQAVLFVTVCRK